MFLFLPLPILVWLVLPEKTRSNQSALRTPSIKDFESIAGGSDYSQLNRPQLLFSILIWLLLVTASARPIWMGYVSNLKVAGRDLMLAVDLSGSMGTDDFIYNGRYIDRLSAAKNVVTKFVRRRKGDRIGLIVFGSRAYLYVPLTFDSKIINTLLSETRVGMAGDNTAIGDAIGLAVKRLQKKGKSKRVLILLTDGKNSDGLLLPEKAAEIARQVNLVIYTIGIGSPHSQSLNEKSLRKVASLTSGKYFRAQNSNELDEIYALIDKYEPSEVKNSPYQPSMALFYWLLVVVFALLFLWITPRIVSEHTAHD